MSAAPVNITVTIEEDDEGFWVVATTDHPLLEPQRTGPFATNEAAKLAADDLGQMLASVEAKH